MINVEGILESVKENRLSLRIILAIRDVMAIVNNQSCIENPPICEMGKIIPTNILKY